MQLLKLLQGIAMSHGATLTCAKTLLPLNIERNAKQGDFSRGVLATVAEIYTQVISTGDGWHAARDLGFDVGLIGVFGGDE